MLHTGRDRWVDQLDGVVATFVDHATPTAPSSWLEVDADVVHLRLDGVIAEVPGLAAGVRAAQAHGVRVVATVADAVLDPAEAAGAQVLAAVAAVADDLVTTSRHGAEALVVGAGRGNRSPGWVQVWA